MLVYSTTLWLSCEFDQAVDVISEWLSFKFKEPIDRLHIKQDGAFFVKDNDRLQVARIVDNWPQLESIIYTQPDNQVSGRLWKTEISLRRLAAESTVEVTVVLSTSEISTRVKTDIQLTRPLVVRNLLEKCSPTDPTPGIQVWDIDETDANRYLEHVLSPERSAPIVLVSPTASRDYPIKAEDLLFQLGGIADIYCIMPDANTFRIQELVGDRYAAWRGAINVIFPPFKARGSSTISNRLYRLEDIEMLLAAVDTRPELEFLSLITHRVNLPNSWRHFSIDRLTEHKRRQELQRTKAEASGSGELREYVALLEEDNQRLSDEKRNADEIVAGLQSELSARDVDIDIKYEQIDQLQKQLQGMQASLHFGRAQADAGSELQQIRGAFVNAINGSASLAEALQLIEVLFPDRVVILDAAWSSADESSKFKYRARAFELLWNLVTRYWDALVSGNGDVEARNIFGEAFSPNEGEAENNRRAVELRTFEYKGEPIQMFRHLGIGIKPSISETLRIHFYWDSADQKIVIGHCGQHLDQK